MCVFGVLLLNRLAPIVFSAFCCSAAWRLQPFRRFATEQLGIYSVFRTFLLNGLASIAFSACCFSVMRSDRHNSTLAPVPRVASVQALGNLEFELEVERRSFPQTLNINFLCTSKLPIALRMGQLLVLYYINYIILYYIMV